MSDSIRTGPKPKVFPIRPRSARLAGAMQSCLGILAINWVFQGMRGMQRRELSFRLLLLAGLASLVGHSMHAGGLAVAPAGIAGLVVGHSFNFLANGQFWVCARYCPAYRGSAVRIAAATEGLVRQLTALSWLEEAVLIGSRARQGRPTDRSDIDLRLVFPPGAWNWLRLNLLLLRLRCRALVAGLPLDLYAYDSPVALARFDQDEPLLVILDRGGRLKALFPQRVTVLP
jgi:hypothetical protein